MGGNNFSMQAIYSRETRKCFTTIQSCFAQTFFRFYICENLDKSSTMSFSVVVFPDEDAIEVVSTSWLSADKKVCHWPQAKQNKFNQLVINHSNPSACTTIKWKSYSCRYLQSYGKRITQITKLIFSNLFIS